MASATHLLTEAEAHAHPPMEAVVVRFAGDSGDGMQLTGGQFTLSTALAGNDLATFPDFPAEIRAPQGTTFGVSAFQINFGSTAIETAGDQPDVLVAMNPAALKTNVGDLKPGGVIIADEGEFNDWKWVAPAELPDLIVPFKRGLYRRLLKEFGVWL